MIDSFDTLSLNVRYDDGIAVYLNGTQVASPNAPASPAWNSAQATGDHPDSLGSATIEPIDISAFPRLSCRVGNNVLAIQLLNTGNTSSDLLLDPRLVGGSSGSSISPTAQVYAGAFPLNSSQTVKARVLNGSGWSAMQTETFLVNSQPASSTNLVVSEVNYRPRPGLPGRGSARLRHPS